ncbi:MAG TPA: hypothetical protein VGJ20_11675 [Xanthobacteraceae bacterium]|jgi:hypothetical protein
MPISRDKDGVFTDPGDRYPPSSGPNPDTPDGAAALKRKAGLYAVCGCQEHAEAENDESRYNRLGAERARQPSEEESEEEEAEIWRWFGLEVPDEIVYADTLREYEAQKKNPRPPSPPEPPCLRKLVRDAFDLAIGGVIRLLFLGICLVILYRSNAPGRSLLRLFPLRGSP